MIPIAKPSIGDEEINAVIKVLKSGMIAQGPKVRELEEKIAKYTGTNYAISCSSGTAALHLALIAAGVGEGDEVITTPFTFVGTANAILMQKAKPVFADIDNQTLNIDPKNIEKKITKKTKAIIAVDLYGGLCDYDTLTEIANKHGINVIEDACQAFGAKLNNKKAGSLGDLGVFSFSATKHITCGEGGCVVTNNEKYAKRIRLLRQQGRSKETKYEYSELGYNYRLTDIQAAILIEQLNKADALLQKRRENAELLCNSLSKVPGLKIPATMQKSTSAFNQFTVQITEEYPKTREIVQEKLKKNGINTAIFYSKIIPDLPQFAKKGNNENSYPVAKQASRQVLSIPLHSMVDKKAIDTIIQVFSANSAVKGAEALNSKIRI